MANITPKQKKDLLGLYKDYLYFSRGLEFVLNKEGIAGLAGRFIESVGWKEKVDLPWHFQFTTKKEQDDYIRFASGDTSNAKYSYMSLYHTKKDHDVPHKKITAFPESYDYETIDLNLPCLVERYAIAYPLDQKLKDATFLIDGEFLVYYTGKKFADTPIITALNDQIAQKEFRILLNLVDYCNRNKATLQDTFQSHMETTKLMMRLISAETAADFENKVLDLLGSNADKTCEILKSIYPDKKPEEVFALAEQDNLIPSAEKMLDYLNIRHLIRHQWDSLNNTNKFSFGANPTNEKRRNEYLNSYHKFFDLSLIERIKEYQQSAQDLQTFLSILYPEFLAREQGETNSKFIARIKQWQLQNPNKNPMINSNYPLKSDKHLSLINNLKKVAPNATVIDHITQKDLDNFMDVETAYFCRTAFLRAYNRLTSNFMLYALTNDIRVKPKEMWEYLKPIALTQKEYERWQQYRTLRNNLSHNHLSQQLREELIKTLEGPFNEDCTNLQNFLYENSPKLVQEKDNIFTAEQKDGSVVRLDLSNNTIVSHVDKDGNDLLQKAPKIIPASRIKKALPVKLNYWGKDIIDCRFMNGITVDLNRKKICFPDGSRIYFDAENYNVFQFDNGNKIFTDKTFAVTKYQERGRYAPLGRNEMFMAAPKHKIKTDSRSRLIESSITDDNNQKLITKFYYGSKGAIITLADGTEIKTSATEFTVSHNNVKLTYDTAIDFIRSYKSSDPMTPPTPPFSR